MRTSVAITIGTAAVAVVVAGAVAASAAPGAGSGGAPARPASATAGAPAGASTPAAGADISAADAQRVALAAVPGATVIEIESDDVNDRPMWRVVLSTSAGRVAVSVDAGTGQLVGPPVALGGATSSPVPGNALPGDGRDDANRTDDDRGAQQPGDDHGVQQPGDDHGHGTDDGPGHH